MQTGILKNLAIGLIFPLLLSVFLIPDDLSAISKRAAKKPRKPPTPFKLFDGAWTITEGPFAGFAFVVGNNEFRKQKFALFPPGSLLALRLGKVTKAGRASIKGSFDVGDNLNGGTDPAADLGLTPKGKFSFSLAPDSLYTLTGTFTNSSKVGFAITATAEDLTYNVPRFALAIEATRHRQFSVGEQVVFEVTAALRGPAGVTSAQPELQIAVSGAVTNIEVETKENFSQCTVDYARTPNQVACAFNILGPKEDTAKLNLNVLVPQALSGQRLEAAVAVDDVPGYNPGDQLHPLFPSAVTKKTSVKIKLAPTPEPTPTPVPVNAVAFTGRWQNSVNGAVIYLSPDSDPNIQQGFLNCTVPATFLQRGYSELEQVLRNVTISGGVYSGEFKNRAGSGDAFVWEAITFTPTETYRYQGSDGADYTPASPC